MRELETSLQQYGEFLLKAKLVKEKAAPYCVRWVRRFLTRPATDGPLADQVRRFCEDLERSGCQDWQVGQAEHALRIYFVHFLERTDWHRAPASSVVDERGHANPLAALDLLRQRLRTRHYAYRTEGSYADWVRRFFTYLAERQGVPHPCETGRPCRSLPPIWRSTAGSRPARRTRRSVPCCSSAGRCLGVEVENLALAARARRGSRLPVVLSVPEVAALLGAMRGTAWLMAALIYCGGLPSPAALDAAIGLLDGRPGDGRGNGWATAVEETREGQER
jgi:hypothetical protein